MMKHHTKVYILLMLILASCGTSPATISPDSPLVPETSAVLHTAPHLPETEHPVATSSAPTLSPTDFMSEFPMYVDSKYRDRYNYQIELGAIDFEGNYWDREEIEFLGDDRDHKANTRIAAYLFSVKATDNDSLLPEEKINRNLRLFAEYAERFRETPPVFGTSPEPHEIRWSVYPPIVHFQSDRFISIEKSYLTHDRHCNVFSKYMTLDVGTGNQVLLRDLVNTNEAFIELLKRGRIGDDPITVISDYINFEGEGILDRLGKMEQEEIQRMIDDCSVVKDAFSIVHSNTFYVMQGKLILAFAQDCNPRICLELDLSDIAEFLKVEPW